MQSDFPTNTRGLGRRIGQSQAFGLLAARCSSTPAHCLQSIREKRLDEPAGVSFEEFRAIRATPAPPALLPRRLPELASFRKNPRPIRVVDTSGILLELASFGQHPKPLRLQHLPPQIGFVREIAIFPQLASFRRGAARASTQAGKSPEAVSPGSTAGSGRKRKPAPAAWYTQPSGAAEH